MNHYQKALRALGWVEVTLWYRVIDSQLVYNHLEDGHAVTDRPTPISPEQKRSWAGGRWVKRIWFGQHISLLRVIE